MKDHNDNERTTETASIPTYLSLCSGYDGIGIALKRVIPELRTVAHVEIEAFAICNLVEKMEAGELDACPVFTDLKRFPFEDLRERQPTILSAGFPCQPFSSAGKRQATDDPRHLYPFIADGITSCRPEYVFLENVDGIVSSKTADGESVLLYVLRDLESRGYTCSWGTFSAAEIGAPHLRKRVFILAKLADGESIERQRTESSGDRCERPEETVGSTCTLYPSRPGERQREWEEPRVVGGELGNAEHDGLSSKSELRSNEATSNQRRTEESEASRKFEGADRPVDGEGVQGRPSGSEQLADTKSGESGESQAGNRRKDTGGGSGSYVAYESSERRRGRTDNDGGDGQRVPEQAGEERSILRSEATGCGGDEEADPSEAQSELGGTTDGTAGGVDAITNRVDRLRLLGNGVVPDCAELAFRTLFNQLAYDCTRDTDNN